MRSRSTRVDRLQRAGWKCLLLAALFVGLGIGAGCDITSFTGPPFVVPGTTVKYEVNIQSAAGIAGSFDLHVLMRVPAGFSLTASNYNGTVLSTPVSGTPTVSATDPSAGCDFASFVGSPPVGYQDLWFSESFAGSDYPGDSGTLMAEFDVHPNIVFQEFVLLAATAYDDASNGFCVETDTRTIHTIAGPVPAVGPWGLVGLGAGLGAAGALGRRRRT